MSNQLELAFNQIVNQVEPLTRFDKTIFKQESGFVRSAAGKAFWRYSPAISNNREERTGRLPYHATRVAGSAELEDTARKTLESAYEALPRRIQSWLRVNECTDRRLEASDCFEGPKTFGYDYKCPDCGGDGWLKCSNCTDGYNPCAKCDKKGHFDCSNCRNFWGNSSTGEVKCNYCGGKGKQSGQKCQHCRGGKITCSKCNGHKIIECRPCSGKGYIRCKTCEGKGRVACLRCDETGYLQVLRTISCAVRDHFGVDLKDSKQEVVTQLTGRGLSELRMLANVTQRPPAVRDNVVEREYDVECVITEIVVQAAGTKLDMIGFGGKAQIFDFNKIVPIILDADLLKLDEAVAKTPYRLWGTPAELIAATSLFLDSEVNIRIDDEALLRDGTVDGNYVSCVKTLIPAALGRIISAKLWLPLLVTALVPVTIYLISYFTGLRDEAGNWLLLPPLIAAVASWALLERRMCEHLRSVLNDDSGRKVDPSLDKYYLLWKARGLTLTLTVILLAATMLAVSLLTATPTE